ncbi:hypothetical protein A4X13_0g2939 [Tilletia indica]|uniref:Spc7 kinetochore protein domain-containing protein n=1 Tax=Tilletia indica TaxID=43049 RepID=A0A177TJ56_9BASI|nr:hypothetical protein A4X13_0g2939 [Tilletia indica]
MPGSPLRATQSPRQSTAPTAQSRPRHAPRKSSVRATPQVFASPSQILMDPSENTGLLHVDEHLRKKRRVTFSRRQELTDYDREEPTVNIRPASEMPMPDTPSSANSSNMTQSSVESDSMSMDMSMTGVYHAPQHQSPRGTSTSQSAPYHLSSPRRPSSLGRYSTGTANSDEDDDEDSESESDEEEGEGEEESMSMDMSMTGVYHAPQPQPQQQQQRSQQSPAKPVSAKSSPAKPSPAKPSFAKPSPAKPSSAKSSPAKPSPAKPSPARTPTARSVVPRLSLPRRLSAASRYSTGSVNSDKHVEAEEEVEDEEEEEEEEEGSEGKSDEEDSMSVDMSLASVHNSVPRPRPSTTQSSLPRPSLAPEFEQTLRETAAAEGKNKNLRDDWLPKLRALHAQLKAKAQKESARTEAIKSCDPDELAGLHQAIEEQSAFLSEFRQQKKRAAEQFQRVQSRLDEVLDQKQTLVDAISGAREVYQSIQGCTRGEAARLLQEVGNVQRLHLWTVIRLPEGKQRNGRVELVYDSALILQADLVESGLHAARPSIAGGRVHAAGKMPALRNAEIKLCKPQSAGPIQKFAVDVLNEVVKDLTSVACPATEILRTISNVWLRQSQLQGEFDMLQARWPTEVTRTASNFSSAGLTLRSSILLKRLRAKVRFQVGCSAAMLLTVEGVSEGAGAGLLDGHAGWETNSVRIESVYGAVDSALMTEQVIDCLERSAGQVGPSARLVHACETVLTAYDV